MWLEFELTEGACHLAMAFLTPFFKFAPLNRKRLML